MDNADIVSQLLLISGCNFENMCFTRECQRTLRYFVNKQAELFQNNQFCIQNQKAVT